MASNNQRKVAQKELGLPQATIRTIKTKLTSAQDASLPSVLSFASISPYPEKKNEAYMNANQLAHFQNILTTWRAHLVEKSENTIKNMQTEQKIHPDPMDAAAQQEEFAQKLQSSNRDRILLKKIAHALQKIENKTFGFCEETGDPIGIKRLEARPIAIYCVAAQEKHERNKQLYARRQED
jgi:DnaK suppressor protein